MATLPMKILSPEERNFLEREFSWEEDFLGERGEDFLGEKIFLGRGFSWGEGRRFSWGEDFLGVRIFLGRRFSNVVITCVQSLCLCTIKYV